MLQSHMLHACTLTSSSAAICAIVKTSKLNELADLEDFTCELSGKSLHACGVRSDSILWLDGTVDLLIWAV